MGPIGCPETSVKNYHSTLRNIPEQRRSHQHHGGGLKSWKLRYVLIQHFTVPATDHTILEITNISETSITSKWLVTKKTSTELQMYLFRKRAYVKKKKGP
jgi:hypothetical protein